MGWQLRRPAGAYYYRSYRGDDGRVVKEYLGRGERAEREAAAVAGRKASREADQAAAVDAGLLAAEGLTRELGRVARLLSEARLLASGYHRSNYGPWRKRREQGSRDDAAA